MIPILRAVWDESLHPRAAGKFAPKGAAAQPAAASARPRPKPATRPRGTLAFDGKTGTGYGKPNGDARVHKLQAALNRLGMTDAGGNKLALDGKLGPRTTAAIKSLQRKLGMKADGAVSPALLRQIAGAKDLKQLGAEVHAKENAAKAKALKAAKANNAKLQAQARPQDPRQGAHAGRRPPDRAQAPHHRQHPRHVVPQRGNPHG